MIKTSSSFPLLILILSSLLVSHFAPAQTFPSISTEQPDGEKVVLPTDLNGKKSIVFLAFTERAEHILDDWYAPVYTMFLDKTGINSLVYDCNVKLVMMFTGAGQAASETIMTKIRENVDQEMNDYLLFYQGSFKEHMRTLDLKKKDDAYVLVLDESGKILLQESGKYSESKLDRIGELVEL